MKLASLPRASKAAAFLCASSGKQLMKSKSCWLLAEAAWRSAKALKVRSTQTNYDKLTFRIIRSGSVRYPTAWKGVEMYTLTPGMCLSCASHVLHISYVCCQNLFSSLRGLQGNVWVRSVKREGLDSKALRARNWKEAADEAWQVEAEKHGYGSIPIHTIFRGMNIHLPAILMFTRGIGFWPIPTWKTRRHAQTFKYFNILYALKSYSQEVHEPSSALLSWSLQFWFDCHTVRPIYDAQAAVILEAMDKAIPWADVHSIWSGPTVLQLFPTFPFHLRKRRDFS